MRIVFASMLALAACQTEAQRHVLDDISRELGKRDAAKAVDAYQRYRAQHGEDEAALRALAVGAVRQALSAPDPGARRAAVLVAERHDVADLFDDVTVLLGDEDEVVRATAASAVLRSHPDAARVAAQALQSESAEARAVAVAAIGRKIPELAGDELRAALADADPRVRLAAATALAETDAAVVAKLAREDAVGTVRAAAVTALGDPAVARAALGDAYLGARLAALGVLGRSGARELLASTDRYLALRAAAILGDPAAGGAVLRAALAAPEAAVREAALNEAAAIDSGSAPLVEPLARDADPRVRLAAARALARLGRAERAREVFAATVSLDDDDLRRDAAVDLVLLGDPRGENTLATLAAADKPEARRAAVAAFPARRPVPPALLGALADVDFGVRVAAAEVILRAL